MKQKFRQLKQDQSGAAMVAVLCILAVFLALALALLLAASALMRTAGREISASRVKIEAITFSDRVEEELAEETGSLYQFVQEQLRTGVWLPGEAAAKEFTGNSGCELSLILYWERRDGLPSLGFDGAKLYVTVTCTRDEESYRLTSEFELTEEEWQWQRLRRG